MKKQDHHVSRKMKVGLFLMFFPLLIFGVLVGTKTVLPVFPIAPNYSVHSFIFFERYSPSVLNESLIFCTFFSLIGGIVLIREGMEKGFSTLAEEFMQDVFNPKRIIKKKNI